MIREHWPLGGLSGVVAAFVAAKTPPRTLPVLAKRIDRLGLREEGSRPDPIQLLEAEVAQLDIESLMQVVRGLRIAIGEASGDLCKYMERWETLLNELKKRTKVA